MLSVMSRTYPAILQGDRVRWTGPAPAEQGPVRVSVTVEGPAPLGAGESGNGDADRGRQMAEALTAVAASGAFADVRDVSAWQREVRADRAMPGRDGDEPPAPGAR